MFPGHKKEEIFLMYEVEKGKVKVQDIEMAYAISGKGYPLVLIMGFAGLGDYWGWNFVSLLAEYFRVILFDNRGLGNTTRGEEPFSIPRFADDTAGLMDALSIKSAHVMGWSMGSFIAPGTGTEFPGKGEQADPLCGKLRRASCRSSISPGFKGYVRYFKVTHGTD